MESDLLSGFPVVIDQPIAWGEMDAFNHVNNAAYFRYFENARIAYLQRIGWWQSMAVSGIGPIVASIQARFRRPLTFPDSVLVGARATELSSDRFTMEHRIVSRARGELTTEGSSVIVSYLYPEKRKVDLPPEVRQRIEELEGRR